MKGYDIIENISNPVIIADTYGQIQFLNAVALTAHSLYNKPLQVGEAILETVPGPWKPRLNSLIQHVCDAQAPASVEVECTIHGKKKFYDVACCPIPDPESVGCLMFEFKDITLQKIHKTKAESSPLDLTSIMETVNAVVVGIDVSGFIVAWNSCAAEITGYTQAEALARHFTELIVNEDGQNILFQILARTMEGHSVSNCELPVLTKNSKKLNLLLKTTSRKNADMEITGIMAIGFNITELTEYKHALEDKVRDRLQALEKERQVIELRKRFVFIASHEFRTPISIIRLQVQALKNLMHFSSDVDIVERLNNICDQAEHMSVLLDDVLLIGNCEAGKITTNVESIELRSFLESIISDVESATKRSHRVLFTFPGDQVYVSSDKCILRKVFVNLLSNAIKFSPGQSEVHFDVIRRGLLVEFAISDKGIGINECDIQKIFQPFNRAASAKGFEGSGLGLSIAKTAVEVLNGCIRVESKPNSGSKFTVQLRFNPSGHEK